MMDGKSQEWRDAADNLLDTLAVCNQYIVADMLVIFLESAGYGLKDYTPLGGVFKRAAKRGIIKKIPRHTKQALWASAVYQDPNPDYSIERPSKSFRIADLKAVPELEPGKRIRLVNFGSADGNYRIAGMVADTLGLVADNE